MAAENLEARLAWIEQRLALVERNLAIKPSPMPTAAPQPPPIPAIAAPARPPISPALQPKQAALDSLTARTAALPSPAPRAADKPELSIESLVGGRWFAVLGALGTVVGIGLFLKLAYDQGWLGRIPPDIRCWFGALFGAALLVAGEFARRRLNHWLAAGLSGAGIAAIYAAVFAAHALFGLISQPAGFALLASVSAIGIAIAARSRFVPLAQLAMVGAYLVPFLLGVNHDRPLVLPAYLLALLVLGSALSAWLRGGFRSVGALAWWATMLLGSFWVISNVSQRPQAVAAFVAGVWALVHTTLWLAARSTPGDDPEHDRDWLKFDSATILQTIATTTWSVVVGVLALRRMPPLDDWVAPLAGCAATALAALAMAGHLRFMLDPPTTRRERLGAALMVQSAALLIATVAMAATGVTQLILWLGMGVAAMAAAQWTASRAAAIYGLILLGLGAARLLAFDAFDPALAASGIEFAGLYLTRWTGLMIAAGACWMLAGLLWPARNQHGAEVPVVAGMTGVLLLMGSVVHKQADASSVAVAWLLIGLCAAIASRSLRRLMLQGAGLGSMLMSIGAWTVAYISLDNNKWHAVDAALGLHPGLWLAAAIAAGLTVGGRVAFPASEPASAAGLAARWTAAWIGAALLWLASSLEVARIAGQLTSERTTQLAAVSIWWAVLATAMIVAGFAVRHAASRWVGLGLMVLASMKVVFVDLRDVPAMWRVISFMLVGLLMLSVAGLYTRRINQHTPAPDPGCPT